MSKLETNTIDTVSGGTTLTLGASGKTINIPSGGKLETNTIDAISGSTTLTLGGTNATNISAIGSFLPSEHSAAFNYGNFTATTVATTTPTAIVSTSITPHRTNSRILLIGAGDGNPNQSGGWHYYTFYRGSTQIGGRYINENAGGTSKNCPFALTHIDHPNTTSSTTYTVRVFQGSGSFTFGETGNIQGATIVAVEIL